MIATITLWNKFLKSERKFDNNFHASFELGENKMLQFYTRDNIIFWSQNLTISETTEIKLILCGNDFETGYEIWVQSKKRNWRDDDEKKDFTHQNTFSKKLTKEL